MLLDFVTKWNDTWVDKEDERYLLGPHQGLYNYLWKLSRCICSATFADMVNGLHAGFGWRDSV